MKRTFLSLLLCLLPALACGQTQTGRLQGQGQSTFDSLANTQVVVVTGVTPDVSAGNVFKTNNGGPTNITNFLNGHDAQTITVICGEANTTFVNGANIATSTGSNVTCVANQAHVFVYDASQTKWIQTKSIGSGSGASAGAQFSVQHSDGAGGFAAGVASDNGTTFNVPEDTKFKGPNPWVDVTQFGARTVSSASIPTTTATINSGSASATLVNGSSFQNNDGIRIDNAGATISLTTPSAPTVQSVLMGGLLQTPVTSNANAGSTTYGPYQIVARTKLGGWTIASAGGSTTTGPAALGIVATTISSTSLSGNTVTVNTTAPSDIVSGAMIWQPASGNPPWSGLFKVGTVSSSTQFNFTQQGLDSIGAGPAMSSGTIDYIVCNHVTWPAVTNAYQYWVYLNNARIGVTRPGETFYDDCGPTIRGTPVFPAYMPTTAPVAASPDPLVTTIVSGGGTNSVVLAATAGNTVAGARAVFDDAPTIKAAYNSVYGAASGTPLYFSSPNPPARNSYIINSYLDLTAVQQLNVIQAAPIFINETIAVPAGTYWEGLHGVGGSSPPGFGWGQYRQIQTNAAMPGIYVVSGNQTTWDGIEFDGINDQALSMLMDSGFDDTFTRCYFSTSATAGTGTVDYTSMGLMTRGVKNVVMDRVSMVSQMQNNLAMGPWAGIYTGRSDLAVANNTGQNFITNLFTAAKGIAIDYTGPFSDMQGWIRGYYTQGSRTPLLTLSSGSSLPGVWTMEFAECDTTGPPVLANLTITGFMNVTLANNSGASPGCSALSGNVVANLIYASGGPDLRTTDANRADGYTANDGTRGYTFTNRLVNVQGPGSFQHAIGNVPVAPVLAVVAGGTLAVAVHSYQYQYFDILFNGGNISPTVTATTTTGNQTVNITVGTPPLGAFGFYIYRDGARIGVGTPDFCSPTIQNGLTRSDTGTGGFCGNSAFVSASMGDTGIRNQNVYSPSFTIIDPNNTGWLTSTAVPKALTNNRTVGYPNQSGQLVLTSNLQSAYDSFTQGNGAPSANWTQCANGITITGNTVFGTASGYNCATYTGTVFSNDQYAQATLLAASNSNGNAGVGIRGVGGYDCLENGTQMLLRSNFGGNNLGTAVITFGAGDVLRLEGRGTSITCKRYVAGVLTNTLSATDGGFTSGQPLIVLQPFNGALLPNADNFSGGTLNPLGHLDNEQEYVAVQHFDTGFTVGTPPTAPVLISEQGNSGKIQQAGTVGNSLPMCSDANGNTTTSCSGVTTPLSTAYLTSNYTNATTAMSNVTGLSFPVAANTKYKVRCDLDYQTSATTADVQLQWTGPAAPTFVTYDMVTEVTSSTLSTAVATAFSTALAETGTPTITTNFPLTLTMTLSNGANAGTIQLQAAATGVGTITIIPGSCSAQQ